MIAIWHFAQSLGVRRCGRCRNALGPRSTRPRPTCCWRPMGGSGDENAVALAVGLGRAKAVFSRKAIARHLYRRQLPGRSQTTGAGRRHPPALPESAIASRVTDGSSAQATRRASQSRSRSAIVVICRCLTDTRKGIPSSGHAGEIGRDPVDVGTVVAICSILIASLALIVSILEARAARKYNECSVRPLLELSHRMDASWAGIHLVNYGLGPAVVDHTVLVVDGSIKGTWDLVDIEKILPDHRTLWPTVTSLRDGRIIGVGYDSPIYGLKNYDPYGDERGFWGSYEIACTWRCITDLSTESNLSRLSEAVKRLQPSIRGILRSAASTKSRRSAIFVTNPLRLK
jgi:hypothetical protein